MSEQEQGDLFDVEEPKKPVEPPKEEPKLEKKSLYSWVPQMINGEWEIY
jgi:hypothetical protein